MYKKKITPDAFAKPMHLPNITKLNREITKLEFTFSQLITLEDIPPIIKRPKNINGDIVADFTLTNFKTTRISGVAFEVDLVSCDFKEMLC